MSDVRALPSGVLSSRWRRYLARSLITLFAVKLVALVLMKAFLFSEDQRLDVTPTLVEEHLRIPGNKEALMEGVTP